MRNVLYICNIALNINKYNYINHLAAFVFVILTFHTIWTENLIWASLFFWFRLHVIYISTLMPQVISFAISRRCTGVIWILHQEELNILAHLVECFKISIIQRKLGTGLLIWHYYLHVHCCVFLFFILILECSVTFSTKPCGADIRK